MVLSVGCIGKPSPTRLGYYPTADNNSYTNNNNLPPLPNQQKSTPKPINTIETKPVQPGAKSVKTEAGLSPSEIYERLSSAVFKIHTSTGYEGFQGSGFFISNDGIAVSNYHVFQGTTIGYENIILSDGSTYKLAEVYHKNEEYDFIIFKVNINQEVNYIKIANTTPKVGEKIYTIGSPLGLDNTFSSGEISQIRENGNILQISAPIDHGSSGGVLLNSKGEAVGITSGGIDTSGANLNYAWNIRLVKPYIP